MSEYPHRMAAFRDDGNTHRLYVDIVLSRTFYKKSLLYAWLYCRGAVRVGRSVIPYDLFCIERAR